MGKESNSQEEKKYTYNATERLVGYTSIMNGENTPNIDVQYQYDPMGRRILKSITRNQKTTNIYFFYNGTGLMGELNDDGQLTKAYGFSSIAGEQGFWSTDPIWQAALNPVKTQPSTLSNNEYVDYHFFHTDHIRVPFLATNKKGQITWAALADSFGNFKNSIDNTTIVNLRYPGQYFDEE